jgi:hypothetical protein
LECGDIVDGRFRLVERIGAGGMGVVFRAIDQRDRGEVAVKLLSGRNAQDTERARREAAVLARLSHPAIVRHVADGVLDDGRLYLAMEWIEGATLGQRIGDAGLTLREAVGVARQIAHALASAHRSQVVHRDVKPSNILLANDDPTRATLIDFSIALAHDAAFALALTRPGSPIGTPGYMSPEQARGERELTLAADVFGLGCVLYESATATPAFSGTAAAAVMAKILLADPVALAARCPEAPRDLVALVARMLAKRVADRLPDCGAVVAAIDALGDIPDGPRRSSRWLTSDATQVECEPGLVHCLVAAARGNADDTLAPPAPDERARLAEAARSHDAHLEILATGAVVMQITGARQDAAPRAAQLALAMRRILPGWTIVISSVSPALETVADRGTALLTSAALGAIFGGPAREGIQVDPATAALLAADFEIAQDGGLPTLIDPLITP